MGTFSENAPQLTKAGFGVLPAQGKMPLWKGFNSMKAAPSAKTIAKYAEHNPDADIVYVPGLSRAGRGRKLVVVDADTPEDVSRAEDIFGKTPGKVKTRRGAHLLYGIAKNIQISDKITGFREQGFDIDLKHGQGGCGIVVAPPSKHEKDPSFRYAFDGCDETVISSLTLFPLSHLEEIVGRKAAPEYDGRSQITRPHLPSKETLDNDTNTAPPPPPLSKGLRFRQGSRGLGLNDYLCKNAWCCTSRDQLIDLANRWNLALPNFGYEMLEDKEVIARADQVWKDNEAGKIKQLHGTRADASINGLEFDELCQFGKVGMNAHALLTRLRLEHASRMLRGETFAISSEAMATAGTVPYSAPTIAKARNLLLELGYIVRVKEPLFAGAHREAAEYVLVQPAPIVQQQYVERIDLYGEPQAAVEGSAPRASWCCPNQENKER